MSPSNQFAADVPTNRRATTAPQSSAGSLRHAALAWVALVVLGAGLPAARAQVEYTADGTPTALEEEIRWHLNRGRFDRDRENQLRGTSYTDIPATAGPLAPNHSLTMACRRHSEDMARNNIFQHDTIPGSAYYNPATQPTPWDRIRAEGYNYSAAGENIAAGQSSARSAYVGWWNSTGHRQNMYNSSLREIGNGYFHWASSAYKHYYTMDLGSSGIARFFTDTLFHDASASGTYDQGEGVAGIRVRLSLSVADHTSFDISSVAGAFAVPIQSIPVGSRVEVRLVNTTATEARLSVPRDYDRTDAIVLAAGGQQAIGTFTQQAATRNFGFRDLTATLIPAVPRLTITRIGAVMELRWPSQQGVNYWPQSSPDLIQWTDLVATPLAGTGSQLTHRPPAGPGRGFYRIRFLPQ